MLFDRYTDYYATPEEAEQLLEARVMVDVLHDIEVLENLVIAMTEGASDEKRMALHSVEKLIIEKKAIVTAFEKEFADDTQQAAINEIVIDLNWPRGKCLFPNGPCK